MLFSRAVPSKTKPDADPDALVLVQIRLPGWMKERAGAIASAHGKSLSEWIRDVVLGETGARDEKRGKGGGR